MEMKLLQVMGGGPTDEEGMAILEDPHSRTSLQFLWCVLTGAHCSFLYSATLSRRLEGTV
jgi:hypothetical protein